MDLSKAVQRKWEVLDGKFRCLPNPERLSYKTQERPRCHEAEKSRLNSGNGIAKVGPNSCVSLEMTLPKTNSTLEVSFACESWYSPDKDFTYGRVRGWQAFPSTLSSERMA